MKRIIAVVCMISMLGILSACSVQKLSTEKLHDLDFTVVKEEDIPKELGKMISDHKEQVFKLTYADQGLLYIAEGYGKQPTSGYSIEVKDCFESKNAVYFHTNLIGPSKTEMIVEQPTYPYIVIKMNLVDKNVVFQ